ncbi:hypothetical protein N7486_004754 [Penicillium sp. IBT 16267x]|nr:hypothetical protein N7486_004754 [Penicillium sp. IBT 16267x]
MIVQVHSLSTRDEYAVYPNPFYKYSSSTGIPNPSNALWTQQELHLADGVESLQGNPFGHPSNPRGLLTLNANLTRIPYIPSMDTFLSEGLNKRATFFGYNATDKITIVYLPNLNLTYPSNTSTLKLQYLVTKTEGMIGNGLALP